MEFQDSHLMQFVAQERNQLKFADLKVICRDNVEVKTHRIVLCGKSEFLRNILEEQTTTTTEQLETPPTLILPNVTHQQFDLLLSLLYGGSVSLLQSQLQSVADLIHLLELTDISVAVCTVADEQAVCAALETTTDEHGSYDTAVDQGVVPTDEQAVMYHSTGEQVMFTTENVDGQTVNTVPVGSTGAWYGDGGQTEEQGQCIDPGGDCDERKGQPGDETVRKPFVYHAASPPALAQQPVDRLPDHQYLASSSSSRDDVTNNRLVTVQPEFNQDASNAVTSRAKDSRFSETEKLLVKSCVLCGKKMLGRHAYGRHMRSCHPKTDGPYFCPVKNCGKSQPSGESLLSHMYVHSGPRGRALASGRKFACDHCDASYTTASRLATHLKSKHQQLRLPEKSKYKCNADMELKFQRAAAGAQCQESFATASKFSLHMTKVHNLSPWLCENCGKRLKDKQNYVMHRFSNHDSKEFDCDICGKVYKTPRQLYVHRALHSGRRFLCSQCGYRARSVQNLRGHIKAKHKIDQQPDAYAILE